MGSEDERTSVYGLPKKPVKNVENNRNGNSFTNILTPCSTQRNVDFPNFISRRNLERSHFNPVEAHIPTSSRLSDEQYPTFFSAEEIYFSKEDIEKPSKPLAFHISSHKKIPLN